MNETKIWKIIMCDTHITFNQRKIKKNYRSITGHFPSIKNVRSVSFESKLEKSLFLTLEFNDSVYSYQEQPQIEIIVNGKILIYSADCYIKRSKGSLKRDALIEVKYTSELEKNKEQFKDKFEAIKMAANEMNLDFILFTEENYSEIELYNLHFLYRYRTNPLNNKYEEIIMNKMIDLKKIKAKDLVSSISNSIGEYSLISNTIWSLVANDKLKTDIVDEELSMNSYVELL